MPIVCNTCGTIDEPLTFHHNHAFCDQCWEEVDVPKIGTVLINGARVVEVYGQKRNPSDTSKTWVALCLWTGHTNPFVVWELASTKIGFGWTGDNEDYAANIYNGIEVFRQRCERVFGIEIERGI